MFNSGNMCVRFLLLFEVEKFQSVSNELPALRTSVSYTL